MKRGQKKVYGGIPQIDDPRAVMDARLKKREVDTKFLADELVVPMGKEPIPYGEFSQKDIEDMMESFSNSRKNKGNKFILHHVCSVGQYMRVSSGYDEFQRALCRQAEIDSNIWTMNEFISRNNMESEKEAEYKKCKEGDGTMTGPEYFWYNYCHINGKLPEPGSWSQEAFENYKLEVGRKRNLISKRRRSIDTSHFPNWMEQPKTPEEAFYKIEL